MIASIDELEKTIRTGISYCDRENLHDMYRNTLKN
ncbi:hypothetical protein BF33_2202 [Bacillus cereus]|uniref:Uncharacterized protein n=1 Tax=Bacillus thuringiensis TaxID=1428 RepID=A0AB33B0L6_BACTU|nr:hypothetical protein BF38_3349 [Bacillus thuringiensis]AJH62020.1 hypothetical protein BG11_1615 [Bacillus cereus]AJK32114.1 hypothetical protein BF33_2202 [Bacillus cereus]